MKKIKTYSETVDIIRQKIDQSNKSLYEISDESGVAYNLICLIKNKYKKPFPDSVIKLLKYFAIESKRVMAFEIDDEKPI